MTPPTEAGPPAPLRRAQVVVIMVALLLCTFLAALDIALMATAIPTIAADMHSAAGYTWIGGAYLLAYAASYCIWTKLSDIWGRKVILLTAVAWFFVSCIIGATSINTPMLIAGRALQGTAGGGLFSLSLVIITDLFDIRKRGMYIGLMELAWGFASGIGPLVGGSFAEYVSWRWCFWINLPISAVAFCLTVLFLDVHNPRTEIIEGIKEIDWFGILFILGFTLMLLVGLNLGGGTFPWSSPTIICLLVFGCLCIFPFICTERRWAKYPLVPPTVFTQRSTIATLLVSFTVGFVFISGEYYLPMYFQSAKGYSPLKSGALILPLVLTEAITSLLAGVIMNSTGLYVEMIRAGLALTTLGTGLYIHLDADSSLREVIGYQIITGVGCGLSFHPPIIAIQAMVTQGQAAAATGAIGFVQNLATASSVVLGGVVFQNGMRGERDVLLNAGIEGSLVERLTGASAAANIGVISGIGDLEQRGVVMASVASSLRNMWILYTCAAGIGIIASLFIVKKRLGEAEEEQREAEAGTKVG